MQGDQLGGGCPGENDGGLVQACVGGGEERERRVERSLGGRQKRGDGLAMGVRA